MPSTTSGSGVDQSFRPAMSSMQVEVIALSGWFSPSATSWSRVGRSVRAGMSCTLLGIAVFSSSVVASATSLSDVGRPFGGMSCTLVVILTSSFYLLVSHDIEQCSDTHTPSSQTKVDVGSGPSPPSFCGYSRVPKLSTLERSWTSVEGTKVGGNSATYRNFLREPTAAR